ncbi:MAG TPA: hypothetical protein VHA76_15555 [Solirubrobacterales bacterium]|nr:hypothetical protein [Solirubrobacterales bacterium]
MSRAALAAALLAAVLVAIAALPGSAFAGEALLRVEVQHQSSGAGTVTSVPAGIDCGGECAHEFAAGTTVTLHGEPAGGSEPPVWTGCDAVVAGDCEVTVNAARTVTATFLLGWHTQQPSGAIGPTALGEVGDISCWQANRCVLTTKGNGGMPAGIYAFNGVEWHLYSTVCGGTEGKIAWAGPNEFWTIADQPAGQVIGGGSARQTFKVSLCHFKDGAVVASYAEPIGVGSSYRPMNAAACNGPDECWFAGERLPGTGNVGAFHLYWNGLTLTPVPSLSQLQPQLHDPGRSVFGLAYHRGALYEGVTVAEGDTAPGEAAGEPDLLHRVVPGTLPEFVGIAANAPVTYGGAEATAADLQGFRLSDGGGALWAASGAHPGGSTLGAVTVLRLGAGGLEQVTLDDPRSTFKAGDVVSGLAAEPGTEAAWIAYGHANELAGTFRARVALVRADGTVEGPISLPLEGEGAPAAVGPAGPITCPAVHQCWMASSSGWLFHLGPNLPVDEDPAMNGVISFRPPDNSLPSVPPIFLPEDNSGADEETKKQQAEIEAEPLPKRKPALLYKLHQKLIGHTLELTFVLRAKAHVQLLAKRKGKVVAKTGRLTLDKGPGRLRVRLDPRRWPTKLDLQVHPVATKGSR